MARSNKSRGKEKSKRARAGGSERTATSHSRGDSRDQLVHAAESRRAEVITVGWMLSVFATLIGTVTAGVVAGVARLAGDEAPPLVRMLPGLLILIASISGLVGLLLIYPTYRWRRLAPPPSVTWFAVVVCAAPLVIIAGLMLRL